jgi:O-antigen ligase
MTMLQNLLTQKLRVFSIIFVTTGFGILSSTVLLKSTELASAFYSAGVVLTMILVQPFIGILNYLVLIYLRPQDFLAIVQGLPLVFIMGGVTLAFVLINAVFSRERLVSAPQNFLIMWLFVAALISHLGNAYIGGAIGSGKEFLNLLFVYFLCLNLVTTENRLRIVMWLLCFLTLYLAVTGIYQGLTGVGIGGQTMVKGRIRGIGIFADPNDLCLTFLMVIPFLMYRVLSRKNILVMTIAAIVLGVLVTALYMTNSRGGMLSFMAASAAMFVKRFGRKVGIAVAVIAIVGLFALGPSRLSDMDAKGESAYGRVAAWSAGLDMFKSSPLFGVGMDTFADYHVLVAHNSFVHAAAELGIFGLVPWVLMIFVSMRNLYYVSNHGGSRNGDIAELSQTLFFGFLGFMVALVFLSRCYYPLLYIMVGLSAAAVQIFVKRDEGEYQLITKNDYMIAFFGSIIGLILLQAFLLVYWT